MSTPAAKRRRVDAANATLRKPFHSPVIRRPDAAAQGATPGASKTPDTVKSSQDAYSPSSPSVARQPGSQRPPQAVRPARSLSSLRQAPLKFKTPLAPSRAEGQASDPEKGSTAKVPDQPPPGASLLALVQAHSHTASDAAIRDLDKQLETARQARRIEDASARRRPGGPVDQELRDLVARWKGASRQAAEEMFEVVRARVESAGGTKAWAQMRREQHRGWKSWDADDERAGRKGELDEGDGDEGEAQSEDGREARGSELENGEEAGEAEEDEPEFNMAQMLRSLNIELDLLGYDEAEEKWVD